MANEHNFVFCATKWIGMADEDIGTAIGILGEFSNFPKLTDRLQQSMVNQLFLARLMIHPSGFVANPAFQDASGNPVIDTSDVFYDGNSQGGIFGGTVMSVAQDITRGVLGVPGMNYSLLLTRSTDFALYAGHPESRLPEPAAAAAHPGARPDAVGPVGSERLCAPHDDRPAAQHPTAHGAAASRVR